ncbi:hypothetical protein NECAME_17048 [Necator americanus]|uniref:ATP synthase F(0) complex subunit e, mitochondrial n=1 Tax=Necator americanus TaxID=51031 RepID=W2TRJ7_NECAM|nr:hypothetical protein NECAME_17048 [Necator americanus]ETN84685.1 hypothetical protein NECAME_17048 [Necator americanus]
MFDGFIDFGFSSLVIDSDKANHSGQAQNSNVSKSYGELTLISQGCPPPATQTRLSSLPPPTQTISPLIRFDRYTAPALRILWGAYRLCQIRKYHAGLREREHENV